MADSGQGPAETGS